MIRFTLDKIMQERGLEQKDIVEITGINRNTIKALANNANNRIDFPTLDRLCNSLKVKPADLIEHIDMSTYTRDEDGYIKLFRTEKGLTMENTSKAREKDGKSPSN